MWSGWPPLLLQPTIYHEMSVFQINVGPRVESPWSRCQHGLWSKAEVPIPPTTHITLIEKNKCNLGSLLIIAFYSNN